MRSIALCVCAFAFVACSSGMTGQTPSALTEGQKVPPGQEGEGTGGGGGGGGGGGATGDASVLGGCTYTQGFWKNHASAWPVTTLTIGGVSYTEPQLLDLFDTAPMGDASLILGHQLIAALLNTANGAAPSPSVQQAIDAAQAWMAANLGSAAGLPYGVPAGSAAGQQATALTQTLDDFNSGLAGTPHCGDGTGGGSSSSSTTTTSSSTATTGTTTATSTSTTSTSSSASSSTVSPPPR